MFLYYLKMALRNLWKQRFYSGINLLGLTIGIAGCMLILLYAYYEFSFDRFHEYANRTYRVNQYTNQEGTAPQHVGITMAPLAEVLANNLPEVAAVTRIRLFDIKSLFCYQDRSFYISNVGFVDSTIFDVFTLPLLQGDPITALSKPSSIVLGEEMAEKLFGDESPLGKSVTWGSSKLLEVTGVMRDLPANSHLNMNALISFDLGRELWPWMSQGTTSCLATFVRLRDGVSPETLNSKFPEILHKIMSPEEAETRHLYLQPLTDIHLGSSHILYQYNQNPGNLAVVQALIPIAVFILLLACINYTNLTTACSAKRSKEVGIRKVTGAHRKDLLFQFLIESVLITMLALILAISLVEVLLPFFRMITGRALSMQILFHPLAWVTIISGVLLVGVLSGSFPALYLSRFQPIQVFRTIRWSSTQGSKLRRFLVVLQFTISIALIASTLIVLKQLHYWQTKNLGFDREQVIVVPLNSRDSRNQEAVLKEKILVHPSVRFVSATSNIPGEDFPQMGIKFEGMGESEEWTSAVFSTDYDFLGALQAQLVQGRSFTPEIATDEKTGFIINQTAAAQLGWTDPLGKELQLPWFERKGPIIGVIHDFNFRTLHHAIEPLVIVMEPSFYGKLLIRTSGHDVPGVLTTIRKAWQELTPTIPFEYSFLDTDLDRMYNSEQNVARLLLVFSGFSIFIACLGLFGLAAFIAEQKTKEIGIRKTLGASVSSIVLLLTRNFALWVIVSNLVALPLAYYIMKHWLQDFAYRIDLDPIVFLLAAFIALAIAMTTISFQAIRAAIANPVNALRYE